MAKVDKDSANYRKGTAGQRCGLCVHFRRGLAKEPDSCTVVAGDIEANMVSDYFKRR